MPKSIMSTADQLMQQYPDLYNGIGELKEFKVNLHIEPNVQPVVQPHHRIPFHINKKVEHQLQYLEELGVMEKVEGPTPWVFPIVANQKPKNPDKICICIDMHLPNTAVLCDRRISPTVDGNHPQPQQCHSVLQT